MTDTDDDPRFTMGLIYDVFQVLAKHGYAVPDDNRRALGAAVGALWRLCRIYEGRPLSEDEEGRS